MASEISSNMPAHIPSSACNCFPQSYAWLHAFTELHSQGKALNLQPIDDVAVRVENFDSDVAVKFLMHTSHGSSQFINCHCASVASVAVARFQSHVSEGMPS